MSEDKNTEVEQAAIEPEAIEGADELAAVEPAGTDIDLAAGDEEDEDSEDSLTFSNGVIEKIVALAMRDVPGVVGMKGSWFNRVQDAFGASDTKKGVTVEVTPESALAHPTWHMGSKITIDSATLMNKGLEVIEAHHLFQVPIDDIRVLVHRQSKIHSMVEFVDGVVKAQLGGSDMRAPIQYALSYPERWEASVHRVDWCGEPDFTFDEADERTFGCLALAKRAGREHGTLPCAMNAANEVANEAFRRGLCGFLDIERSVGAVMDAWDNEEVQSVEQLLEVDRRAREMARAQLGVAL